MEQFNSHKIMPASALEADQYFARLRPYNDHEVAAVLARLSQDSVFQKLLAQYYHPHLNHYWPRLMQYLVARNLQRQSAKITTIADFQLRIAQFMEVMLARTVTEFKVSGLAELKAQQPYLYISNHRDIALDPAFVNLALHRYQRATVRIAIGDNLLKMPFASDLMRLNKSFIVPRSSAGKREMLQSFQLLAEYIHHSLQVDQQSIWLAQRQGRAKDGIDYTDPALLKMLTLPLRSLKATAIIPTLLQRLSIVPVSISYQYDPCDLLKACELTAVAHGENYQKNDNEDLHAIALGITGFKGQVHLHFGQPINPLAHTSIEDLAIALDQQIIANYQLTASHYLALETLNEAPTLWQGKVIDIKDRQQFDARLAKVTPSLRYWWLRQYANPVLERAKLVDCKK